MDETTFQKYYLQKVRAVLDFAINNAYSDFYRKKYNFKPEDIKTYEDFKKIPFLTKDEILDSPLEDRLFMPKDMITHYAFSSGTTNQDKVLVMPHFRPENQIPETKYVFDEDKLKKLSAKNFLILLPPMTGAETMVRKTPKKYVADIMGDVSNLRKTALISSRVGIDSLVSIPTILYFFIQELKKTDFNFEGVKFIWLLGEHCGKEKYNLFKSTFPNAEFKFTFGGAESTSGLTVRGYRCDYYDKKKIGLYHLMPVFMYEVIDYDGKVTGHEEPGEFIQTDLETEKMFPLIRYKTGDVGIIRDSGCKCGNRVELEMFGRDKHDALKFHGVTLYAHLIEECLVKFSDYLNPFFEMHVSEKKHDGKILPLLSLKLSLKNESDNTPELAKSIKNELEQNLFLAIGKNLKYFIDNNIYSPLEIIFVADKEISSTQKQKRIVSHLG